MCIRVAGGLLLNFSSAFPSSHSWHVRSGICEQPHGIFLAVRRIVTTSLPVELVLATWRLFAHASCMTALFAQGVQYCRFCDELETERQAHCAACLVARLW